MLGSSNIASNTGPAPDDGLKNTYSTPAAFNCAIRSSPPLPCIGRNQEGFASGAPAGSCGMKGARDFAIEFAAVAVTPSALMPERNPRRETSRSIYFLIKSFMRFLLQPGWISIGWNHRAWGWGACSAVLRNVGKPPDRPGKFECRYNNLTTCD